MDNWIVLRVRTGRELMAREWLERMGGRGYVPILQSRVHVRRRRRQASRMSVAWPGYLFAPSGQPTAGCADIIAPLMVPDSSGRQVDYVLSNDDIAAIQALEREGFAPDKRRPQAGEMVRVAAGIMSGLEGEVVSATQHEVTLRIGGHKIIFPALLIAH